MKTDRFSDIIRRKLESIRPEFTEKDWARMQATLQQAGPPQSGPSATGQPFSGGVWAGKSWLLAAASVSTVALIAFSIWQRSEINHLQKTIGQLKQKAVTKQITPASAEQDRPTLSQSGTPNQPNTVSGSPAESVPAPTQREELATSHDTVYITRYVPMPETRRMNSVGDRSLQRTETPPDQRYATASRAPVVRNPLRQSNNLNKHQKSDSYGVSSTPLTIDNTTNTPSETINNPLTTTPNSSIPSSVNDAEGRVAKNQRIKRTKGNYSSPASPGNAADSPTGSTGVVDNPNKAIGQQELTPTEQAQVAEQSGVLASYEVVTSRPLSTEGINWNALMAQRAKRMRLVRTTTVTMPTQAPESKKVEPVIARFRAGIGGEFESRMWSVGLFSEIPVGKHVVVGVGLSQATYMGGLFITASDFNKRTQRNFRDEFGKGLDPKLSLYGDIINVDTRMVRVQIPISLGYRVPLTHSLTMIPNVGTYLVLSNKEKVTFNYRQTAYGPYGGYDETNFSRSHPTELFSNVALSLGLEWQNRRWVVQGSPVLTLPTCSPAPGAPNWQVDTSIGLRARLMYQF
ncbi:hypothetical protein GCM10028805_04560 [Spirosoma harenae]